MLVCWYNVAENNVLQHECVGGKVTAASVVICNRLAAGATGCCAFEEYGEKYVFKSYLLYHLLCYHHS